MVIMAIAIWPCQNMAMDRQIPFDIRSWSSFDESILQGLAEVIERDRVGAGEVGDGAGDADHAVEGARRHVKAFRRAFEQTLARGIERRVLLQFGAGEGGVDACPRGSRQLTCARAARTRTRTAEEGSPGGPSVSCEIGTASASTTRSRRSRRGPTGDCDIARFAEACTCRRVSDHRSTRTDIPALPFCTARLTAAWKPSDYPKEFRHFGDHIRAKRLDLGLQIKQLAARLGSDEGSVACWENGSRRPSLRKLPKILEFLGYDPLTSLH